MRANLHTLYDRIKVIAGTKDVFADDSEHDLNNTKDEFFGRENRKQER
jgi:hypothetical protein